MYRHYVQKKDRKQLIKAIHNSICCKHSVELEIRLKKALKKIKKLGLELSDLHMKLDSLELLGKSEEQLKHDVKILAKRKRELKTYG